MSKLLEKILSEIPLRTKIKTYLIMEDYDNWENGEYKGDKKRIEKMTDDLLGIIKEHKKIYKGPEENCPSCGRPKESPKLTCYHIFHKV